MRIRWRLALYGSFVALIAMVVFTVILSLLAEQSGPEDQRQALGEVAAEIAGEMAAIPTGELVLPDSVPTVDVAESDDPFVTVVDPTGETVVRTGRIGDDPIDVPARIVSEALREGTSQALQTVGSVELQLVALRWFADDTGEPGVVVASQPTRVLQQRLDELGAVLFVAGIITLLVAAIVGWFVTRRALRPIRQLAVTTDRIGSTGDLTERLPAAKHRDEVGVLTKSFNGMLDRLQESQTQLGRSLDAQRQFVADASHELRSPLTTIRNNAGFLLDRPDVDPQDRDDAIADIAAEANRMSGLVEDLLALARSGAGPVVGDSQVDLVEVIRAVLHHVPPDSATVDAPASAMVRGDRAALHRLVRILVDNAIKHGGGVVDLTVRPSNDRWHVSIADRGPGFPPDDLVRVFDRFYRADPARTAEGSGLGMAIAQGVVSAHDGTILAANRPGGGATIEFDLPA